MQHIPFKHAHTSIYTSNIPFIHIQSMTTLAATHRGHALTTDIHCNGRGTGQQDRKYGITPSITEHRRLSQAVNGKYVDDRTDYKKLTD